MNLADLWDRLLRAMQHSIGHDAVEVWLKSTIPLALNGKVLTLEVANRYYRDWIVENYQAQLQANASELLDDDIVVKIIASDDHEPANLQSDSQEHPLNVGTNPHQTFEAFVVGECNRFAQAAALAVADSPGKAYNPLYIWGPSGLGKTHLLHAIANRVLSRNPTAGVLYVTSEDFVNDVVTCIRHNRQEDLREKYRRRAQLLLVDDIQFLTGRDATQKEFFHTFNTLQAAGHQIVITSDVPPKQIDKLEGRLRTRFEGGLIADMQPPDTETLLAILQQKAEAEGFAIPHEVAEAIAHRTEGNVRELEGLLHRVKAAVDFYGGPVTPDFVRSHIPGLFDRPKVDVTVAGIIEAVSRYHNLRSADIVGKKRTRLLTVPRHIAMYLARTHTRLSFPELGKEFGDRDHTTVQHGYKRVAAEMSENADLSYKIRLIEQGLGLR